VVAPAHADEQPAEMASATAAPCARRIRLARATIVRLARAVADADSAQIESAARQLGHSRLYLAPLAWAAGALVLLVRGVKLLLCGS
jgi:hypothetical protein